MSTSSDSTGSYSLSAKSSSSSSSLEQVSIAVVPQRDHENAEWIEGLLKAKFFVACPAHPYIGNYLNKYCASCKTSGCLFCFTSGNRLHRNHVILKVYRHVYRESVLLSQMANYIDCMQIMPYRSNGSWVIALKPHPYMSGAISKFRCQTCGRRVKSLYAYCCLHCKVEAMSNSTSASSSATPFLGDHTSSSHNREHNKPENSLNRRKGIPFRAPFS